MSVSCKRAWLKGRRCAVCRLIDSFRNWSGNPFCGDTCYILCSTFESLCICTFHRSNCDSFLSPLQTFSIPGKWLGRRKVSQDRRRADRRNPVKKAKRTGSGSGISAGDVAGCRGEVEVPPVEESVWTCPFLTPKPSTEALCAAKQLTVELFWADISVRKTTHVWICLMLPWDDSLRDALAYHQLKSKVQGACGDVVSPHSHCILGFEVWSSIPAKAGWVLKLSLHCSAFQFGARRMD